MFCFCIISCLFKVHCFWIMRTMTKPARHPTKTQMSTRTTCQRICVIIWRTCPRTAASRRSMNLPHRLSMMTGWDPFLSHKRRSRFLNAGLMIFSPHCSTVDEAVWRYNIAYCNKADVIISITIWAKDIAITLPMRAALYLRVSSTRQDEHDVSIPDQKKQG